MTATQPTASEGGCTKPAAESIAMVTAGVRDCMAEQGKKGMAEQGKRGMAGWAASGMAGWAASGMAGCSVGHGRVGQAESVVEASCHPTLSIWIKLTVR